jgi:hypothetical protein
MDAVFHAVPTARPRATLAEGADSEDARIIVRNQHREAAGGFRVEPRLAIRQGKLLLRIHGGRIANRVIVDRQYFC